MRPTIISAMFLSASIAQAEVPHVAVDIAPVHSLVAQVMEGAGTPDLIMRPGASPHHYALRPSEAAALSEADLVVWMGEGLTPWLGSTIDKLSGEARSIELLEADGTRLLPFREGIGFDLGDHDDEAEHDNHDEHNDDEHGDHEAHDHAGDVDPHAWLDPQNARHWLTLIAAELSELDPENATLYQTNASHGADRIMAVEQEIAARLAALEDVPFLLQHDAYHYFEEAFDIPAAAAISLGDAARPGPARIAALRDLIAAHRITCVLTEPQFDPKLATSLVTDNLQTGILDPMGSAYEPGAELYASLMLGLADGFAACSR